jgi:hypothetical protein
LGIAGFEVFGKVVIAVSVSIVVARSFGIACGSLELRSFALALVVCPQVL